MAGNEIKTNIEMLELINKYISVKIEHVHDRPGHDQIYKMKNSKLNYKTTNEYHKDSESGIIWNDRDLNINWPVKNPELSDKDKKWKTLKETKKY